MKPIGTLFVAFAAYRERAKTAATATGQVAVLENNCNRIAGLPAGYIYITDSSNQDFAILIPPSVSRLKIEEIKQFVERFKLAGKTYEIVLNV